MTDEEKILEYIEKAGRGVRLADIWGDTGVFITEVGPILEKLEKANKIRVDRAGPFEYFFSK